MSKQLFYGSKSRKHRTGDVKVHEEGKKEKKRKTTRRNEKKGTRKTHREKSEKRKKRKKRDENTNDVKNGKEEKSEEINKKTKRGLKNGSENFSWTFEKAKTKNKNKHRQERKLFLNSSFSEEKKYENIFGELFQKKKWWDKQIKPTICILCFLGWKEHQKRQKKQQNQIVKRWKRRTDWKRGREKNSIFQDVCFLNPSLTSHQKRKSKEKRLNTQSCKQMQKGTTVFEKGTFKKRKLDKKRIFWTKSEHIDKRFVIVSERVKDSENKTTHTKKKTGKTKKRNENIQKKKRTKDPSQQKRWKNDREIRNKAKTTFAKGTRRGRDSEDTRRQWKNHQKKGETQKKRRKSKTKKIMIKTEKEAEKTRSMTTVCTWDLTRPTTSRHAAMVNRAFNLKSWYFLTRKDYQNMRSGHFVAKAIFLWILYEVKKKQKGISKKIEKRWLNEFLFHQITEIQKVSFWRDWTSGWRGVFSQKTKENKGDSKKVSQKKRGKTQTEET